MKSHPPSILPDICSILEKEEAHLSWEYERAIAEGRCTQELREWFDQSLTGIARAMDALRHCT